MTRQEVLNNLEKNYNEDLVNELYIYLRNDRRICNSMNRSLGEFVTSKLKKNNFDKVLFIQAVKLEIDKHLSSSYFKKEYGEYLPSQIDSGTKYQLAKIIASYIFYDFFRIKL